MLFVILKRMVDMRLTVKQALSIEGLNRCKVVAGKNGLSREISCVDTMEIRDIGPWLKEKELLLTTGYSIQGDSAKLIELIESLHNVGAAGIAIKTRFWGTLPEEALALAEKLSIPVITIPDEMPFVDLLMPLIQAILDIQNEMLKFSSKIHNQFTELELSGGGLEGIVNMLYELLSMPAIITDRNLKIITSAPETIDLCNIFENIHTDLQLWANDSNTNSDVKEIRSDQYYVVGRKARFKGDVCSYILIFCSEARFSEMHMVVLDHAATTAALEYSKQDAIRQRLSRMDNNCFIDIIMRNIKSEAEAQHRAQNLGWQSPPFSLVVCDINNFEENIRGKSEMEILSLKQQVEEYIRHIMLKEKILCTIISKSDSFSSLCASVNADELVAIGRMIVKHVQEKLNIKLYVGVSTQLIYGKHTKKQLMPYVSAEKSWKTLYL